MAEVELLFIFTHWGFGKQSFHPYYSVKDIINFCLYLFFIFLILEYPYILGEVELFEESNSINSPVHIIPE